MANTVTNTRISANKARVIQYITIASDGTEETDLVIYDSSAVATALGIDDPLDCTILSIYATVSAAATARVKLEFDATTDVLALDIPVQTSPIKNDFSKVGGLANTAGTGITGDITLTTTGLESGDTLTIIIAVKPN